ncbi:MAG: hypothetical protein U1C59_03045 [Methylotenera sp.]|jgi:hypothetical protein|uniref:hypothetical protein n=1 Tax=Methylotenera sp. TaxID=2051956 RepID=UPI00271D0785|nr:hypothetical protein [Methylotenera sp.]MDO9204786.1 hypothetical protein [Methylotenera sp.]MDP3308430.1 hypothetical protein [Methylotenera sp.]MDP3818535.1 hypothetical protein [Methylotenera sp.]MDZ4210677.1 hypothetical protein [Methylotenera sp.]
MLSGVRAHYIEAITSASYLGILAFVLYSQNQSSAVISLVLVAAISLFAWASTYKRVRAIADIATSRIGSAAQGYVELYGRASVDADNLIKSPLSGMSCIWFRYWVYTKGSGDREWRETAKGVSHSTFEIKDGTGSSVVDPDDAEVLFPDRRVSYQGNYKHVEEMLFAGGSIYVLGEFSTIGGANSVLSVKEDVSALLTEWKNDPVQLKKRFDLDGNGEIDLQEWELARRVAIREVEKQHRAIRAETGVHIMRAPRDGRLFLISSMSPQKLRQRYQLWSYFHLSVLIVTIGAFFWL